MTQPMARPAVIPKPVVLPLAVQDVRPVGSKDTDTYVVTRHIALRGSPAGAFGETHLVFEASGRFWAATRTSALDRLTLLELDGAFLPVLTMDNSEVLSSELLVVQDPQGLRHSIALDSLARRATLRELAELYEEREAWRPLAKVLLMQVADEYAEAPRTALQLALARLHIRQLQNFGAAATIYRQILIHDEDHTEAIEGLLETFAAGHETAGVGPYLAAKLEALDRWKDALEVREALVELDGGDRLDIAQSWLHRTGSHERALAAAGVILCGVSDDRRPATGPSPSPPTDDDEANRAWTFFASILDKQPVDSDVSTLAETIMDTALAVLQPSATATAMTVAFAARLATSAPERAVALWETLRLGPEEVAREAAQSLIGFYRDRGETAQELSIQQALVKQAPSGQLVAQRWCRVAELHLQLGDEENTTAAYRAALKAFPEQVSALVGLDGALSRAERWSEVHSIVMEQVALEPHAPHRAVLLKRAGRLATDKLGNPEAAVRAWLLVRAATPDDPEVVSHLVPLLRSLNRLEELAGVLTDHLTHGGRSKETRDAVRRLLARLYAEELHAPERAVAVWQAVLDVEGEVAEALAALVGLSEQRDDSQSAIRYLRRLAEAETGDHRGNVYLRLGMKEAITGDHVNAIAAFDVATRSLPPEARAEALEGIAESAVALGKSDRLLKARRELATLPGAPKIQANRRLALAQLLLIPNANTDASAKAEADSQSQVIDEAERLMGDVLRILPEHLPAARLRLTILRRRRLWLESIVFWERTILERTRDEEDAAGIIELGLSRIPDSDLEHPATYSPMGATVLRVLGDYFPSLMERRPLMSSVADRLLRSAPSQAVLGLLAEVARDFPQATEQAATFVASTFPSGSLGIEHWLGLGLWRRDRGEVRESADALWRALEAGDTRESTLEAALDAALDAGDDQRLLARLDILANTSTSRAWNRGLLMGKARVAEALGEPEQAVGFRRAANGSIRALAWIAITAITALIGAIILL